MSNHCFFSDFWCAVRLLSTHSRRRGGGPPLVPGGSGEACDYLLFQAGAIGINLNQADVDRLPILVAHGCLVQPVSSATGDAAGAGEAAGTARGLPRQEPEQLATASRVADKWIDQLL